MEGPAETSEASPPFGAATSEILDDDSLREFSEEELARIMTALQGGVEPCLDASPGSSPDHHDEPLLDDAAALAHPGAAISAAPGATVPLGAVVLGAVVALCVTAILVLVYQADDPSDHQLVLQGNDASWQPAAAEESCDALRRELSALAAERDRLRQEVEKLRRPAAQHGDRAMSLAPPPASAMNETQLDTQPPQLAPGRSPSPTSSQTSGPGGSLIGQQLRIGPPGGPHGAAKPGPDSNEAAAVCEPCPQCPSCPPANTSKLCPPCPPDVAAPPPGPACETGATKEEVEHLRAKVRILSRETERLREEPQRLQASFHAQSEQIWHLRAEASKCSAALQQVSAEAEQSRRCHRVRRRAHLPPWHALAGRVHQRKARSEKLRLQGSLAACEEVLRQARERQEQLREIINGGER